VIGFFVFLILWAHFAIIDEVTKGEGKAIPSSRIQKIQNLEGGIVAQIYVHEGQIVDAGAPLVRLDDTRFASNVGETEADRVAMELRVERLSAEVENRPLNITEDARKAVPKPGVERRIAVPEPTPATVGRNRRAATTTAATPAGTA